MRSKIAMLLSVLFCLTACQVEIPDNIIPPERMEALLYDYHLAQSLSSTYGSAEYKEKLLYTSVFDKHKTTKEKFDESLQWYNRNPKRMRGIYKNLEARLQSEVNYLSAAKMMLDEGVAIDAVNLEPNIAELWTSNTVKSLSSTPLTNRLTFSFNTPKDSSFVAGDSLLFSFNAFFVPSDADSVKQNTYAAINLLYNDKSVRTAELYIDSTGHYELSVPRNYAHRLRTMSGYVFYVDNDSTCNSRVILSDISVKRLHPAQVRKKRK